MRRPAISRRYERRVFLSDAEIRAYCGTRLTGSVINIGRGGALVCVQGYLPVGTAVELVIGRSTSREIAGRVVSVRVDLEVNWMGIAFHRPLELHELKWLISRAMPTIGGRHKALQPW
jgi:hypothetical protein